jgi:diacylglycerol kinase family enzyme
VIGGQVFVNNASFGAYAEVVQTPAYRSDKLATTLQVLPDLLHGHRGARLAARADGTQITAPRALLVANNPYGSGDIAGLSRRARLDRGLLGVVSVTVASARQAAGPVHGTGLIVLTAKTIDITADADRIPVGIDGEAVLLPAPVQCAIRPARFVSGCRRTAPASPVQAPVNWARLATWPRPGNRSYADGNARDRGAA